MNLLSSGAGREHTQGVFRAAGGIIQWDLLKPCVGNNYGTESEDHLSINCERILSQFPAAVCQNIYKFQVLQGNEAERSI